MDSEAPDREDAAPPRVSGLAPDAAPAPARWTGHGKELVRALPCTAVQRQSRVALQDAAEWLRSTGRGHKLSLGQRTASYTLTANSPLGPRHSMFPYKKIRDC